MPTFTLHSEPAAGVPPQQFGANGTTYYRIRLSISSTNPADLSTVNGVRYTLADTSFLDNLLYGNDPTQGFAAELWAFDNFEYEAQIFTSDGKNVTLNEKTAFEINSEK